ncbi:mitochondrial 54S ribosomal protein mL49 [Kwoniella pini CBS 10737]|uniref:Large ribosomal subunit protein mL49 n=2 Tax=Kwoniella pini CBS 10737 TaxID=1296096 RepID=A0AAJ8L1J0_9TREE
MRSTISTFARMATRGRRAPPPLPPSAIASSSSSALSTPPISDDIASSSSSRSEGWYHVNRSEGGELPVYSKIRNGGGITTIIRKVDGDVRTLQNQLTTYLSDLHIDPFTHSPKVTVRPTNNHLQIKGHWVQEVKGWLEGRGF